MTPVEVGWPLLVLLLLAVVLRSLPFALGVVPPEAVAVLPVGGIVLGGP